MFAFNAVEVISTFNLEANLEFRNGQKKHRHMHINHRFLGILIPKEILIFKKKHSELSLANINDLQRSKDKL